MFCGNCGQKIKEGNKFCTNCGTPVETVNQSNSSIASAIKSAKCVTEYKINTKVDDMDVVKFGKYQQSDLTGKKIEDIQWLVLEKQNDRGLLLSKYVIDVNSMRMNADKNWGHQEIREYLNTIFLEKAFTAPEISHILDTKIQHNDSNQDVETESND